MQGGRMGVSGVLIAFLWGKANLLVCFPRMPNGAGFSSIV
jgi:hypothetical protein